jgi:hypothetical protein
MAYGRSLILILVAVVAALPAGAAPASAAEAEPLPNGAQCGLGSQCRSTFCADGVCCDTACDRPFETCDALPTRGTCVAVAPTPPLSRRGLYTGLALLTLLGAALLWQKRRVLGSSNA